MVKFNLLLTSSLLIFSTACRFSRLEPGANALVEDPRFNPEANLLCLKNDHAIIGIMPEAGGRLVLYRRHTGSNILLSDPRDWTIPEAEIPQPDPMKKQYRMFNGHIIWLAPQTDWWNQQDINPDMEGRVWPADPFLLYGRYKIEKRTKDSVTLRGPESPVSGLRLIKSYRLLPNGSVQLRVSAQNIRKSKVRWSLWSNTRLPGNAASYVPLAKGSFAAMKMEYKSSDPLKTRPIPYGMSGHIWFSSPKSTSENPDVDHVAKFFIKPHQQIIAAFTDEYLFLKVSDQPIPDKLPPGHAPIEIFNEIPKDPGKTAQLEVEMVGEYQELAPGETTHFVETWHLLPYQGENNPEKHLQFIRQVFPKFFDIPPEPEKD